MDIKKSRLYIFILFKIIASILLLAGCMTGSGISDDRPSDEIKVRSLRGTVTIPSYISPSLRNEESMDEDVNNSLKGSVDGRRLVEGAKVWIKTSPNTQPVYTDASGSFVFAAIEARRHVLVSSFELSGETFKQKVETLVRAEDIAPSAPPLSLEEARAVLTGVLKDGQGNYLPAGTEMKLWGETFLTQTNGRFKTPPLPISVNQAEVFVKKPGSTNFTSFKAPFLAGNVPAFVEQTILKSQDENSPPSGILIPRNSAGIRTIRCSADEMMTIELISHDPDKEHADRLRYDWSATRGTLNVAFDDGSANWIAMDTYGVATISVKITDPQGATARVSLTMLVGIESLEESDQTNPSVKSVFPHDNKIGVLPDEKIRVGFSKAMSQNAANTNYISVRTDGGNIPGQVVLENNNKDLVWTPESSMPQGQTINVSLSPEIYDSYGNTLGQQYSWSFNTTILPIVTVNAKHTNNTTPTITGTAKNAVDVEVTINNQTYNANLSNEEWSLELTPALNDGTYRIVAKATNIDGHHAVNELMRDLRIDTTPKTALLSYLPRPITNKTSAEIFVGGSGVVAYQYRHNSGNWSDTIGSLSQAIKLDDLEDGDHVIEVRALDAPGNWQTEANATIYEWVVDTQVKEAVLENAPASETKQDSFEITVAGTRVTKYQFRLNNGTWSGIRSVDRKITLANLDSGSYILEVVAGDDAGNWQSKAYPTEHEWTVDKEIKIAILNNPPNDPTTQTNYTFFVEGEGVTQYRYSINNSSWSAWTDVGVNITETLTPGEHFLRIVGRDGLSNQQKVDEATVYIWTIQ